MGVPSHSLSSPPAAGPLGYKGPRAALLLELKRSGLATAKQLAFRLGLSLNAVRHHLRELAGGALVAHESRRHGVGAPSFAYRLTPAGEALFPRRYEATLAEVLDLMVARDGRAAAVAVLQAPFGGLARRLRAELEGIGSDERLGVVARVLSEEGYMAEGTADPDGGTLTAHNCPILSVAERFPEVCAAEARLLADTLGAVVERRNYILDGCAACEYSVRLTNKGSERV